MIIRECCHENKKQLRYLFSNVKHQICFLLYLCHQVEHTLWMCSGLRAHDLVHRSAIFLCSWDDSLVGQLTTLDQVPGQYKILVDLVSWKAANNIKWYLTDIFFRMPNMFLVIFMSSRSTHSVNVFSAPCPWPSSSLCYIFSVLGMIV